MDRLADGLEQAADALTALSREVPALVATPGAFAALPSSGVAGENAAAEGAGLPGRVGRSLHDRWAAALAARSHEAAGAAARLAAVAGSVRTTQRAYTETDEAVQRRFTREL